MTEKFNMDKMNSILDGGFASLKDSSQFDSIQASVTSPRFTLDNLMKTDEQKYSARKSSASSSSSQRRRNHNLRKLLNDIAESD